MFVEIVFHAFQIEIPGTNHHGQYMLCEHWMQDFMYARQAPHQLGYIRSSTN